MCRRCHCFFLSFFPIFLYVATERPHQGRIYQVAWVAIWVAIQSSTQFCRAAEEDCWGQLQGSSIWVEDLIWGKEIEYQPKPSYLIENGHSFLPPARPQGNIEGGYNYLQGKKCNSHPDKKHHTFHKHKQRKHTLWIIWPSVGQIFWNLVDDLTWP
jgi:hypothetical protein